MPGALEAARHVKNAREPGTEVFKCSSPESCWRRRIIKMAAVAVAIMLTPVAGFAQSGHGGHDVVLHVNPRWDECSFQLDPALTQQAWRQFTREAGLVTYFRPLADARPMGAGHVELSILQATTEIDDTDAAWNDTFVHPDETHWLHEGSGLPVPGLMARAGVTGRLDVGAYFTKNPNANYGIYGAQAQYNIARGRNADWAVSTRASFVSLYGPEDLDFTVYGVDVLASKAFPVARWASVSPYAGVSGYLNSSHEKSDVVSLEDENILGVQAMVGAVAQISVARIAVEYNAAKVGSRTIKVGVAF
jgi:hypothetical protein